MKNTIIYLIGFAGTGKYSIAKEIAKLTDAKLVDNHLILNPIFSVIRLDGSVIEEGVWDNAWKIRHIVLDTIKKFSAPDFNFIFTNQLVENFPDDKKLFEEVAELAQARNAKLIPIRLLCDEEELCKRVISEGRKERFKDTNVENARKHSADFELLKPITHPYFTLDVTKLTALEVAKEIIKLCEKAV